MTNASTFRHSINVALVLMTGGCATGDALHQFSGQDMGPTAKVTDSMFNEHDSRADFCVLYKIDGKRIDNAISDTDMRTQGQGFRLLPYVTDRVVKAVPMEASLRCDTYYAAPISALAHKEYPVDGVVAFTPEEDVRYVVKGEMGEAGSAVWIEEEDTGRRVTVRVETTRQK